jgi:multisubunit Na+/H+ antiporter MnhE subunit
MMSLWVAVDDSLRSDELIAGAAAAALAAFAAEAVSHQAVTRYQVRASWFAQALTLPGRTVADTVAVFAALAKGIVTRRMPVGAFREIPVRYGDDSPLGVTRRVLLTGGRSFTPNAFVIGLDGERDVMLVHELVTRR